ncbi:MAG TPA: hypothetical protein VE669_10620 [Actinomycetota bacterium]|jgi:uncharacterized protein YggT (Ycf19 family)|nr:hypothetical protein [Actinomycetota bacterium]
MGEAADRKVAEIDETRRRLEEDLRELEDRIPAPLRSLKSLLGMLVGSALVGAFVLRRLRSKRSGRDQPAAEVVVRIVRDDA